MRKRRVIVRRIWSYDYDEVEDADIEVSMKCRVR